MIKIDKNLEDFQYEEALKKYAELYNLKKSKGKNEREFADTNKMYVIYARKSTEDEKRQVQSIEDQIGHCKVYAHNNNLHVVEIIREEKSAKTAGKRAQFNTMIETIKRGDSYNSILAWHPDRLARNMKESGEIMDLVDNQIIVDLKFSSYTYNNDAGGKLTLSILFAMAKEFSDKLSEDTKRGNHKKISEGKYIGTQKKGYIPNRDDFFRKDANTFEIYRTTWDMYGKGATQTSILKYLADNDIDMSENAISLFFQDPFYAGFYSYGTQIVDLKKVDPSFTPMVAPRDFINVQKINRDNPRGWKRSVGFRPFEHFMMCADCGRPMTPAFSTGRGGRYLKVSCGSQECKEIRRKNQIKPVTNTINAGVILDFAIKFIEEIKDQIDVKIYNNAKEKFMYGRDLNTKILKRKYQY